MRRLRLRGDTCLHRPPRYAKYMWRWLVSIGARPKNPKWYIGFGFFFVATGVWRLVSDQGIEGGMILTGFGGSVLLLGVAGVLGMQGIRGIRSQP